MEDVAVDDYARLAAVLDVKDSANVCSPVACEALVRPAKRVRSENHIVEFEDGIVGVRRLLLEHVEPGAGDPPLLKRLRQRFLVDDRASSGVDEIGGRLHQGEACRH